MCQDICITYNFDKSVNGLLEKTRKKSFSLAECYSLCDAEDISLRCKRYRLMQMF